MPFALSRPASDGREFFAGVPDQDHVAVSLLIFKAIPFDTRADAEKCAATLAEKGLPGFTVSELTAGGTSGNLGFAQ